MKWGLLDSIKLPCPSNNNRLHIYPARCTNLPSNVNIYMYLLIYLCDFKSPLNISSILLKVALEKEWERGGEGEERREGKGAENEEVLWDEGSPASQFALFYLFYFK